MSEQVSAADTGPWRLMRQDDNGNRYLVAAFADRESAQRARAEFEARGHKQIYWVEGGAHGRGPGSAPAGAP